MKNSNALNVVAHVTGYIGCMHVVSIDIVTIDIFHAGR